MKLYTHHSNRLYSWIYILIGCVLCCACGRLDMLNDDDYVLNGIRVESDAKDVSTSLMAKYVRQHPAPRLFSVFKKPGEPAVIYDAELAAQSCRDLKKALDNTGYLNAYVELDSVVKGKKLLAVYKIHAGEPFFVSDFTYEIQDDSIKTLVERHYDELMFPKAGDRFSISSLNDERKRLTNFLAERGYYHFHKDFIEFDVDTVSQNNAVGVKMTLFKYQKDNNSLGEPHPCYKVANISYKSGSADYMHLRKKVLENNTAYRVGDLYNSAALQKTYNNFSRLQAVRFTNISFTEHPDSALLDCNIQISTTKASTISFQPEGTNTAGDLGAAASVTYENRNLFHGSETFSVQGRAAFEAITGLEGYQDQNYQEYSIETKLTFPRLVAPFLSSDYKRISTATSELSASYNLQNRPEFHRRVFSSAWRYRWTDKRKVNFRFDLLDLNYVYMPWISQTFKEDYLDSDDNRNAILKYNYEDLFIMKIGLGATITRKRFALRTNFETSGNVLGALSRMMLFPKNNQGKYTLFNIAFAQYVKGDVDYTHLVDFDQNNQLALHTAIGIAYPYGNSSILPFEKRYFSGGANSVRGWSVRSLGPGKFKGKDGRIDFINQTGDLKIDVNVELRSKMFWKFSGAAFVDAGNIWTLRDYSDQEGGKFTVNEFYKQFAVSYGLGLRLNFDYFILRFDFGMKAVNPAYNTAKEHFPLLYPNLSRDLAFHFAVGLPF